MPVGQHLLAAVRWTVLRINAAVVTRHASSAFWFAHAVLLTWLIGIHQFTLVLPRHTFC